MSERWEWHIRDVDNACSDVECCGGPWAQYQVQYGPVQVVKETHDLAAAERALRRCRRWGVLPLNKQLRRLMYDACGWEA